MRMAFLMTHLWPGFLQLWMRGRWQGLAQAFLFMLLLNLGLISTFVWPELFSKHIKLAIWVSIGCVWVVSILRVRREIPSFLLNKSASEPMPGLFIRAQAEYLKGNWFEAESLLRHLDENRDDVEATLLLGTLLRRTGRVDQAKQKLQVLSGFPGACSWGFEIQRELELIEHVTQGAAGGNSDSPHRQESGMPEAA